MNFRCERAAARSSSGSALARVGSFTSRWLQNFSSATGNDETRGCPRRKVIPHRPQGEATWCSWSKIGRFTLGTLATL